MILKWIAINIFLIPTVLDFYMDVIFIGPVLLPGPTCLYYFEKTTVAFGSLWIYF
jgi:hypothetical protein